MFVWGLHMHQINMYVYTYMYIFFLILVIITHHYYYVYMFVPKYPPNHPHPSPSDRPLRTSHQAPQLDGDETAEDVLKWSCKCHRPFFPTKKKTAVQKIAVVFHDTLKYLYLKCSKYIKIRPRNIYICVIYYYMSFVISFNLAWILWTKVPHPRDHTLGHWILGNGRTCKSSLENYI